MGTKRAGNSVARQGWLEDTNPLWPLDENL